MAQENPAQGASYDPTDVERSKEGKKHYRNRVFLDPNRPEFVVFLQESDYQFVKDILMEKEAPSEKRNQSNCSVFGQNNTSSNLQGHDQKAMSSNAPEILMKEIEDSDARDGHSSNGEQHGEGQIHRSMTSLSTRSSPEDSPQTKNLQQPGGAESLSIPEDTVFKSLTGSAQSFLDHQLAQEESSSFAVGSLFHPIPCSGSVSLRSNSSTASSQSFAFPILPSEWNGSPVRMAKPDEKQLRKHQSWKICFLCCKF
ncbi:hypothetical protein SLA2020_180130 [Shorea laevis]